MAAYTHPDVLCEACEETPATHVFEAKVLVDRTAAGEVESHYRLSCPDLVCVGLSAMWADSIDRVHVDTRRLVRSEAQVISGLELKEAS